MGCPLFRAGSLPSSIRKICPAATTRPAITRSTIISGQKFGAPTTADGSLAPGLLPNQSDILTPSDLDVVLNLVAIASGTLSLGVQFSNGVSTVVLPVGITFAVSVPEPGTAVLMGLGLLGLGTRRRS